MTHGRMLRDRDHALRHPGRLSRPSRHGLNGPENSRAAANASPRNWGSAASTRSCREVPEGPDFSAFLCCSR